MSDYPTEDYRAYQGEEWEPPPPPGTVIVRDQTAARMGAAEELTQELAKLDERRGRVPSGEVRQIVGRAAGTIEALEGEAARVPELLAQVEQLRARVAQAEGGDDERALRLWRAGHMAETQAAADRVYGDARGAAETLLADARRRANSMIEEARRRATLAERPEGLPAPPKRMDDRIDDMTVRGQYLGAVRLWLADQEDTLQADVAKVRKDLDAAEAAALRQTSA